MEYHHISSERLTIAGLKELVDSRRPIALSDELRHRIIRCRKYLDRKIQNSDQPVYGITTATWSCRIPAAPESRSPRKS